MERGIAPDSMKTRIGHLLVRSGLVTEAQLSSALQVQNFAGGRIGTLLLERNALGEHDLGQTLALQHGCGYIAWSVLSNLPPETIALLPARFALKHCAIPYELGERYARIVLRDPNDLRILDEVDFVTGRWIFAAVAPEVRIYQALEKYYGKLRDPRYAILAEKLSRGQKTPSDSLAPPVFFPDAPPPPEAKPAALVSVTSAEEPTPQGRSPETAAAEPAPAAGTPAPPRSPTGADSPVPVWGTFLDFGPTGSGETERITWEDSTGGRSKAKPLPPEAPSSRTFGEMVPFELPEFPFLEEALPPPPPKNTAADEGFSHVAGATERDEIAGAVLDALARRFPRSAIFSSRTDGVSGWAAAGEGVSKEAIRSFSTAWTEPSVFLNVRLSRTFSLGPLPPLPRHEQLAAALGGWPEECLVQPVFIGEKPLAFLLVTAAQAGTVTADDLAYVRDLAAAAATAFANAIRLKKKEI
jgi:hypothetical protein